MAVGTTIPINGVFNGEFNITQLTAATDLVTLSGAASQTGDFLVGRDSSNNERFVVDKSGVIEKFKVRVQTKTADYTCVETDSGSFFTNIGATEDVTFTLPATADMVAGEFYVFMSAVDAVEFKVAGGTADKMVTFNDATADSIAFSTSGEYIGGWVMAVCDGSRWYTSCLLANDAQTPTIAT